MGTGWIGEIRLVGFNFAPRGTALCQGQLLLISSNSALFSLLGTTFGGDGRTTFGLPDLRGRAPIGVGAGPGLTNRAWGQRGGVESVTLTTSQMPAHSHVAYGSADPGCSTSSVGNLPAETTEDTYCTGNESALDGGAIGDTGGGQSHPNMQPYLGLHYVIHLTGVYPSRN